jgi:iron complex transport system substrate-binding protein
MFRIIRLVATLTGQEAEADQLVNDLEKRYAAVTAKTSQVSERPLVFYELDGTDPNAPWTPGPGNFVDTLITLAGGENLGARLSSEWAQISIEELIAQDPDIILIGDATYTGLTLDEVRARAGWSSLTAIQNGNLFTFNDNLVSRPGPRMVEGLEEMAKFLHPELFP